MNTFGVKIFLKLNKKVSKLYHPRLGHHQVVLYRPDFKLKSKDGKKTMTVFEALRKSGFGRKISKVEVWVFTSNCVMYKTLNPKIPPNAGNCSEYICKAGSKCGHPDDVLCGPSCFKNQEIVGYIGTCGDGPNGGGYNPKCPPTGYTKFGNPT